MSPIAPSKHTEQTDVLTFAPEVPEVPEVPAATSVAAPPVVAAAVLFSVFLGRFNSGGWWDKC